MAFDPMALVHSHAKSAAVAVKSVMNTENASLPK
jgi:hypothetical protein